MLGGEKLLVFYRGTVHADKAVCSWMFGGILALGEAALWGRAFPYKSSCTALHQQAGSLKCSPVLPQTFTPLCMPQHETPRGQTYEIRG